MTGPGRNLSHHRLFSCSVLVLTLERARMRNQRDSALRLRVQRAAGAPFIWTEQYNCLIHLSLPLEGTGPNRRREEEGSGKNKGFSGHQQIAVGLPWWLSDNPPANTGYMGSIPDLGRSHMPWSNQAREPQQEKPQY